MFTVQRLAQVFGVVFILVGALGFFSGSMTMEEGLLLGLFPVNALHNVVHILFGIWGLVAAKSFGGAKGYMQIGGILYLVLAVLGFVTPNLLGLIPIGGNDRWLHLVLGAVMAGVGFTARDIGTPARAAI